MSGGGGKGGTTTTTQQIDPALTAAARDALDMAAAATAIPFSPNRGVQIAAFTPQQEAAMQSANSAASAFGLPTGGMANMPAAETSASGIRGYSTGADFDEQRNRSVSPGLQAAIAQLFADPLTGGTIGGAGGSGAGGVGGARGSITHNSDIMERVVRDTISGNVNNASGNGRGGSGSFTGPAGPLFSGRYASMPAQAASGGGGK